MHSSACTRGRAHDNRSAPSVRIPAHTRKSRVHGCRSHQSLPYCVASMSALYAMALCRSPPLRRTVSRVPAGSGCWSCEPQASSAAKRRGRPPKRASPQEARTRRELMSPRSARCRSRLFLIAWRVRVVPQDDGRPSLRLCPAALSFYPFSFFFFLSTDAHTHFRHIPVMFEGRRQGSVVAIAAWR